MKHPVIPQLYKKSSKPNEYPVDWGIVALFSKEAANFTCQICGARFSPSPCASLGVHHLIPDKTLCAKWNLVVACRKCHLSIEGRLDVFTAFLPGIEPPQWLAWRLPYFQRWLMFHSNL